jgi:CMP/dCMP kinase
MPFHIAIDGPVAAGKGTVSRLVAEKLGFLYVDTGAMYRMTALLALRAKIELDFDKEDKIVELVKNATMDMRTPENGEKDGRLSTIFLDKEDVSWKIRTEKVSLGSSAVAKLPKVRKILVKKQQQIAANKDVVMEGRDITYRVLPEADLKIFLTGSDEIRARRRLNQLLTKGEDVVFEKIFKDLIKRDKQDMSRTTDPLTKVPEAWEIDTSDLSIVQVVEMIVSKASKIIEE